MRVVTTIPNDTFTITIFSTNDKYLIKLEGGPMEQTYKIPMDRVEGLEGLKKMLTPAFLQKAEEVHHQMFDLLKQGYASIQ